MWIFSRTVNGGRKWKGEVKWFGFGGIRVRGPSALVAAACGEICSHPPTHKFPYYFSGFIWCFYSVLVFIVQGLIRVVDDESAGFTGVPIFLCRVQVALRIFYLFLSHVKFAYKCFPVCFLLAQRAIGCCAVRELEVARAWLLGCYYWANVPGGRLSILFCCF